MVMEKDKSIETLRGIAIILVVGLHITNDGALESSKTFYEYLAYSFQNIRIPLFTIISGYLYGFRPVSRGNLDIFLFGKARRILLPLIFVASAEFLAKSLLPGVNQPLNAEDFWKAWVYPYEHYWFLQVIFIIFMIYGVLGCYNLVSSWSNWVKLFALSLIVYLIYPLIGPSINFFSLGAVTYLLPFFTLGYGIAQFESRILSKSSLPILFGLFVLTFGYQQILWFIDAELLAGKRTIVGLIVSISSGCIIFHFRRNISILSFFGAYAYTIYLYQGFGTSIGRRLGLDVLGAHFYFLGVIIFTLMLGMLVEFIAKRIPFLSLIAIGQRSIYFRRDQ